MVNNIVYFGRIIATILLIRLISLISLNRPIHLVRLISHSRATLAPLLSPSGSSASSVFRPLDSSPQSSVFRPLDSRLRKPDSLKSLWTLKTLETLETLSLS